MGRVMARYCRVSGWGLRKSASVAITFVVCWGVAVEEDDEEIAVPSASPTAGTADRRANVDDVGDAAAAAEDVGRTANARASGGDGDQEAHRRPRPSRISGGGAGAGAGAVVRAMFAYILLPGRSLGRTTLR